MKKIFIFCICLFLFSYSFAEFDVYYNAKVYTAEKDAPSASAFVVKDGKFIYVGNDAEALKFGVGKNLEGKRVLPGFIDSHCHPVFVAAGEAFGKISIPNSLTLEETIELIKNKTSEEPFKSSKIITGMGFGLKCGTPTAQDLDKAVADKAAAIFSEDGHALLLNTKAMQLLNISKDTKDPMPGASYYLRDKEGKPTGFVIETVAEFDLLKKLKIYSKNDIKEGLPVIQKIFSSNGITSVFEAGFLFIPEKTALEALQDLEKENKLTMRYFTSYYYLGPSSESPENAIAEMKANKAKFTSDLIKADTLKMFGDGTVEVQSAWMQEDYLLPLKGRGAPTILFKDMLDAGKLAAENDFNIHNHAIGDAAVSEALNFHKKLGKINGTKTICHVQIIPSDGVESFAKGDSFYQSTPLWLLADEEFTLKVLGKERYLLQGHYASLIKAGVTLTFGSDFPASNEAVGVNPFLNIWVAVIRKNSNLIMPPSSEAISVKDCIDAYTINGAKQLGAENSIGSIAKGKSADFIICDKDPFAVDAENIKDIKVERTYFRGELVYDKNTFKTAE